MGGKGGVEDRKCGVGRFSWGMGEGRGKVGVKIRTGDISDETGYLRGESSRERGQSSHSSNKNLVPQH